MAEPSELHRRWFHPTPGRCLLGLLAVEGFLLVAQWRCWFAINQRKGWPVLICVAVVGIGLFLLFAWCAASLRFGWRFQFSIRSLLMLVVVVAIPCDWFGVAWQQAKRQRDAVKGIQMAGGNLTYDWQHRPPPLPAPGWLWNLLGDDFFADVVRVDVHFSSDKRTGLQNVKALTRLHELRVWLDPPLNDAKMDDIKGLTEVESLELYGDLVTDAELQFLGGLTHTRSLVLRGNLLTDAGLEYLKGLTQLQSLGLGGTLITDAGLKYI